MNPLVATAVVLALAAPVLAGPPASDFRRASPATWEAAFSQGTPSEPVGPVRGTVLYADDALFPRAKARLQGAVWKGKTFHGDGTFTNRWVGGVRAGTAGTGVEPSWLDGRPGLVLRYPPTAPVFGDVRDELREVAPGVWLGRSFDAATGRPKNWFLLRAR